MACVAPQSAQVMVTTSYGGLCKIQSFSVALSFVDRAGKIARIVGSITDTELTPRRGTYAGVFLLTASTLMYEVLLTRIFSVTMWHHFAFMSISIAMFGLSVGAVLVHSLP